METVIVTWWTWYIWSHIVDKFLKAGYEVAIVDDLSNSNENIINNIVKSTWYFPDFYQVDLQNKSALERVFTLYDNIVWVVHSASSKDASINKDMFSYYDNNIFGTINLLKVMDKFNIKNLVYASSYDVYNLNLSAPFLEDSKLLSHNPYWTSKISTEYILNDIYHKKWFNILSLRLFEVIWNNKDWYFWEDLSLMNNTILWNIIWNILWIKTDVSSVSSSADKLILDFVHVEDVAEAFYLSFEKLKSENVWFEIINIWTWSWHSLSQVLDIISEFSSNKPDIIFSWEIESFVSYADVSKAKNLLWWSAKNSIKQWLKDSWEYINKHFN